MVEHKPSYADSLFDGVPLFEQLAVLQQQIESLHNKQPNEHWPEYLELCRQRDEIWDWIAEGNKLGQDFEKIGNIEMAIKTYGTLARTGADTVLTYERLAILNERIGRYQEALRACDMHRIVLNKLYLLYLPRVVGSRPALHNYEHRDWKAQCKLVRRQLRIARKLGNQKLVAKFQAALRRYRKQTIRLSR